MASESDDDKTTTIQIRLSTDKKQDWIEYLNSDSPHGTLTDLIKTSVDNRIDSKWVLAEKQDDDGGDVPEDLEESIDNMTEHLAAIEDRLDDREAPDIDDSDELDEDEVRHLSYRVREKLPVVQNEDHLKSLISAEGPTLNVRYRPLLTGTAQDIAAAIDEPEHQVRTALIYIERQRTENVKSSIHDGTRRWFIVDKSVERGPPSSLEIELEANVDKEDIELQRASELNENKDTQ